MTDQTKMTGFQVQIAVFTRHALTDAQALAMGERYIGQFPRDPNAHRTLLTDADAAEVVRGWLIPQGPFASLAEGCEWCGYPHCECGETDGDDKPWESAATPDAVNIYGVFPPILRAWLHDQDTGNAAGCACVTTYEWHNTNRAAEGQSPTAETLGGDRWVETGRYFISPASFE